ncbi:MAG TPA: bi-domain-containing oxidoreductase [Solirubrobacteraceae bacterium]|jgi:polar amino acid transport system substrate-binding protein
MKQVTQRLRDGKISVIDIPAPTVSPDGVLVDVRASLLSAGTERSKVKTGRQSLIGKARARPDQVRQVIDKAQRDGIGETIRAVRSRLEQPSPLGYSAAGVVLAVGGRVRDIAPGDRVACGGADYAVHAELDHVPANLCVPLPDGVAFESGAFATVGSIAMHGVRQAEVRLGERVAVIGLGLVGQLAGQILRAAGCEVVGIDLSRELLSRAHAVGAADVVLQRSQLEDERLPAAATGCDAILITAATPSDDPVRLAAHLARDRARVVIVGDVGLGIPRATYYEKELDLRLSRSYGPGRYDREYEERGLDYPIGYVRWTERRNMSSFVQLVASGRVNVEGLVTDRFAVDEAEAAYERLLAADSSPLAMILTYAPTATMDKVPALTRRWSGSASSKPTIGLIGTGSFAQGTVAPGLQRAGFRIAAVASATGLSAHAAKDRFQADRLLSPEEVIADPAIEAVAIVTRHATHAAYATAALRAGKPVFVEKPACLTWDELRELERAAADGPPLLVGFNRRHAPLARAMRDHVASRGHPVELLFRVNAGPLPHEHWLNDLADGGGRLLGEGCHFIDFACWLLGALPHRVSAVMRATAGEPLAAAQSFDVTLDFGDAGLATVFYGCGGAAGLGKEYYEAHGGGRSAVLDDFARLALYDGRRARTTRRRGRDKGHDDQFKHFLELVRDTAPDRGPSTLETMSVTLSALQSATETNVPLESPNGTA